MDAIIRAAAVSPVLRQLRRQSELPVRTETPAPPALKPVTATSGPAAPPIVPPTAALPPGQGAAPAQPEPVAPAREALAAERAQMRQQAQQEAAALRAEAERRGYAVGQEQGETAARQLLQSQVERVKSIAHQLAQAKASVIGDAEDAVVDLAFGALCRILGDRAASRDTVLRLVREGAAATREREQVGIRLHPVDLALLRLAEDGPEPHVRYSADASIELGGCIVDSSTGTLDARLEIQIERLRATLLTVRARDKNDGEAL